ncbi:MAG: hypothetical protein ACREAS_05030, partial [Nitrososphaera sp.]
IIFNQCTQKQFMRERITLHGMSYKNVYTKPKSTISIIVIAAIAFSATLAASYFLSMVGTNHLLISLPVSIIIIVTVTYIHLRLKGN